MNVEKTLVDTCKKLYGKNLAAVLIFGSYFTGNFDENKSDIDAIILFKKGTNHAKEELIKLLPNLNLFVHHLRTIKNYEKEIYEVGSWSSWIVAQKGSVVCYSTPEFEKFRYRLSKKDLPKEKLKNFIIKKDEFDISVDLAKKSGWDATKMLYAHIRRKLQILYYYSTKILEPDYDKCLTKLDVPQRSELTKLGKFYKNRESLAENESKKYVKISRKLTKLVNSVFSKQKA